MAIYPLTTESERQKYAAAYSLENYRTPKHAIHNRWDLLKGVTPGTYLDVSCGRGETVALAGRLGFKARGTEFTDALVAPERGIEWGHLPALEGISGADYVSCYEILEHLVPQDVIPATRRLIELARKRVWISTNDKRARSVFQGGIYNLHLSRLPLRWWWNLLDELGREYDILPLYSLWRPHNPSARNWFLGFDKEQPYHKDWLTLDTLPETHLKAQGYRDTAAPYHFWYNPKHPEATGLGHGPVALLRNLPDSDKRYEVLIPGGPAAVTYGCSEYMDLGAKDNRNGEPFTLSEAAAILGLDPQELARALASNGV